ncbi:chorismate mutase family protein [Rhodococcus sp. KRD162]|uniref:chorismate mutase family protein n=1 Tax=Rhodococcus sp. KRD162 TaxID=2729725 RepID=UPI0019CFC71B|nr:chorismate mutase family protein [Rhodococcus sp. KRD162]
MSQHSHQLSDGTLRTAVSEAESEDRRAVGEQKLAELRTELDGIDEVLRTAIRDRIDVCVRVAHIKREYDIPMMQPGRVGLVTARAREFASANGLSPDFLEALYRSLIAEACRVEDLIIDSPTARPGLESER